MPAVEQYFASLARRQEQEIRDLHAKAARIVEVMGVEHGRPPHTVKVATMYLGPARYQVCRETGGGPWAPIRILRGGGSSRQEKSITDLEEGGKIEDLTELARFCGGGKSRKIIINGTEAKPRENYVFGLLEVETVLRLWDHVLEFKGRQKK